MTPNRINALLSSALLLFCSFTLFAAERPWQEPLRSAIAEGPFAVLQADQIPALAELTFQKQLPETWSDILIRNGKPWTDGSWPQFKRIHLSSTRLRRQEPLEVKSVEYFKYGVRFLVRTLRPLPFTPEPGAPQRIENHQTMLTFVFDGCDRMEPGPHNLAFMKETLSGYLRFFPSREAAEAFIKGPGAPQLKLGMTRSEVIDQLGPPLHQTRTPNNLRLKYSDLTVVIEKDRVKDILF